MRTEDITLQKVDLSWLLTSAWDDTPAARHPLNTPANTTRTQHITGRHLAGFVQHAHFKVANQVFKAQE